MRENILFQSAVVVLGVVKFSPNIFKYSVYSEILNLCMYMEVCQLHYSNFQNSASHEAEFWKRS